MKPSTKQLREFGLVVGFFFPLIIGLILPFIFGHPFRSWTLIIGLPLILLGIFAPNKLRYIYRKWLSIGNFLGFINSHLILGMIFIIVMQPISLIMKLFGYDPLKKLQKELKSYKETRHNVNVDLDKIF